MLGKFVSILYRHFQCILKDSNFKENKKEKLLEERCQKMCGGENKNQTCSMSVFAFCIFPRKWSTFLHFEWKQSIVKW